MIGIRKLGIVVSAAAVAGTALAGALWVGTAHAQSTASLSVTSVAFESFNNLLGASTVVVTFSVTCPEGDLAEINATASQGGTGTTGHDNEFACTGSAQSESLDSSSTVGYAAGSVFVGATLDTFGTSTSTGPYGLAAGIATIATIP